MSALLIKLLLLFIPLALTILNVSCIPAFDCTKPIGSPIEISLTDTKPCNKSKKNVTSEEVYIQLIQPKLFSEISYYQCLIEINHILTYCGTISDAVQPNGFYTELYQIDELECQELVDKNYLNYQGIKMYLEQKDLQFKSVDTIGSLSAKGSCTGAEKEIIINSVTYKNLVRSSNFRILKRKVMGTLDIEENKIILEDGTRCNYKSTSCFSADLGFIFWKTIFDQKDCFDNQNNKKTEFLPIYEGYATKFTDTHNGIIFTSLIIHYQDYDFQIELTGKKVRTCGQVTWETEHPKLSVAIEDKKIGFFYKYEPGSLGKNVNLLTYMNSKLVYAMRHVKEQVDELYEKIAYDKCLGEEKIVQNMMSLAIISPQQFSFLYTGQPGFTGTVRGEVIYLTQCTPVSVNISSTFNFKCYNEIPVNYNGENYFLLPRTKILTTIGTELDCSSILPVKFKLVDQWYSVLSNNLVVTPHPKIIRISNDIPWEFKPIDNFMTSGIYSTNDLEAMQKIIINPMQKDAITASVSRGIQLNSPLNNDLRITSLFHPDEVELYAKSQFTKVLDKIYSYLGILGDWTSFLIGLIIVLRVFKFVFNIIINTFELFLVFGWSWRLIFAWWENMTHLFLRRASNREMSQDKKVCDLERGETSFEMNENQKGVQEEPLRNQTRLEAIKDYIPLIKDGKYLPRDLP